MFYCLLNTVCVVINDRTAAVDHVNGLQTSCS